MKKFVVASVFLGLALTACTGDSWKTYNDDDMKFSIAYPGRFVVEKVRQELALDATGPKISVPLVRIGDGKPGDTMEIFRTDDMRILSYLQSQQPFFGRTTIGGLDYQQFQLTGPPASYGFVTGKNRYFYVFQTSAGPDDPLLIKMLETIVIR